jgi:hypothetical protein
MSECNMGKTDSDTFPDALRACAEEMAPCLAKLLNDYGAFFWIGLLAVVGKNLWVLVHNGGCTTSDLDWIMERMRPGSIVSVGGGQLKHSVMDGFEQINKLGNNKRTDKIRRAETAIRALDASMAKTHEPLVIAITLGAFLHPAFQQMLDEDAKEFAEELWSDLRETAEAPELAAEYV